MKEAIRSLTKEHIALLTTMCFILSIIREFSFGIAIEFDLVSIMTPTDLLKSAAKWLPMSTLLVIIGAYTGKKAADEFNSYIGVLDKKQTESLIFGDLFFVYAISIFIVYASFRFIQEYSMPYFYIYTAIFTVSAMIYITIHRLHLISIVRNEKIIHLAHLAAHEYVKIAVILGFIILIPVESGIRAANAPKENQKDLHHLSLINSKSTDIYLIRTFEKGVLYKTRDRTKLTFSPWDAIEALAAL